jgi:hypothetical protein
MLPTRNEKSDEVIRDWLKINRGVHDD